MANYSGQSHIKTNGTATAVQIDAWIAALGKQLAPTFAPDKTYKAPPEIGLTIIDLCGQVGINADLVVAQIAKESAGWQSEIVRTKNNPSGLGAVNADPMGGAIKFDAPAAGIKATIAHLLSYIDGTANPWWSFDPRATAISSANLGVVQVLSDLDGRWAVPGNGYGAGIAQLANELTATTTRRSTTTARIIVSAGHENIQNITADKIGASSQAALRTGTGALGREAQWTGPWADALVAQLKMFGINAVRTDAIYHADVYSADADLVIVGHCDGTNIKRAQWCMAAPIISGGSTDAADAQAKAFTNIWYAVYPAATGIAANGPVTTDMTQEYEGWYRSPNTPAVLVEHFILGNGGVWSNDLTPAQGAEADASAITQWLGIEMAMLDIGPASVLTSWTDPATSCRLIGGMLARWQQVEAKLGNEIFLVVGHPVTNECDVLDGSGNPTGEKEQKFEHQTWRWKSGQSPEHFDILAVIVNPFTPTP
ncbi:MAG TPA: hypothetical protein VHV31_07135 [Nitrolancea sp.]|nr:hypothetical protein [Nitrolancea sp.]